MVFYHKPPCINSQRFMLTIWKLKNKSFNSPHPMTSALLSTALCAQLPFFLWCKQKDPIFQHDSRHLSSLYFIRWQTFSSISLWLVSVELCLPIDLYEMFICSPLRSPQSLCLFHMSDVGLITPLSCALRPRPSASVWEKKAYASAPKPSGLTATGHNSPIHMGMMCNCGLWN